MGSADNATRRRRETETTLPTRSLGGRVSCGIIHTPTRGSCYKTLFSESIGRALRSTSSTITTTYDAKTKRGR
ncbi:hypothetical protein GGTG_00359 [Gaeumannomyces tritici R3-111a-1]|uniref:Uncharacterized protein n=1 Tax=Gaeumannomyces tritici (strain R3-111a-1) TaxID=644352 RepID=J3NGG9_GAET3|nr:hypothetical protein GGTG_00359 [Gaeumannomyces tritici R3-111a-1]EJT80359.1 hypothetical protein GGTG_00359 [Gaeumannomyces tritici R3-111a-1]